jgi:hypothetical protein
VAFPGGGQLLVQARQGLLGLDPGRDQPGRPSASASALSRARSLVRWRPLASSRAVARLARAVACSRACSRASRGAAAAASSATRAVAASISGPSRSASAARASCRSASSRCPSAAARARPALARSSSRALAWLSAAAVASLGVGQGGGRAGLGRGGRRSAASARPAPARPRPPPPPGRPGRAARPGPRRPRSGVAAPLAHPGQGPLDRADPEQVQHQPPPLPRDHGRERGQLLLLGAHRGQERPLVHPHHRAR